MARPPVQSKSKAHAAAERIARDIRAKQDAERRRLDEEQRKEADRKRATAATAARRRREEELKKVQLSKPQVGALQRSFAWVKDWSPQSMELIHLETEAGHVTFDHLAELAEAFATRDINVVGQVDYGYYPEDADATVMIVVRGPMLLERIRLFADFADLRDGVTT